MPGAALDIVSQSIIKRKFGTASNAQLCTLVVPVIQTPLEIEIKIFEVINM